MTKLHELADEWERRVADLPSYDPAEQATSRCADELRAALSAPLPPTSELVQEMRRLACGVHVRGSRTRNLRKRSLKPPTHWTLPTVRCRRRQM